MFRRRQSLILTIAFLLFLLTFFLPAEEIERLQMSYYTMVYSFITKEDLADINFLIHTSVITDDSIPVFIKMSEESKYNSNMSDFNFKNIRGDQNLIRFKRHLRNFIGVKTYNSHR